MFAPPGMEARHEAVIRIYTANNQIRLREIETISPSTVISRGLYRSSYICFIPLLQLLESFLKAGGTAEDHGAPRAAFINSRLNVVVRFPTPLGWFETALCFLEDQRDRRI